jgi:hypothetical protein
VRADYCSVRRRRGVTADQLGADAPWFEQALGIPNVAERHGVAVADLAHAVILDPDHGAGRRPREHARRRGGFRKILP